MKKILNSFTGTLAAALAFILTGCVAPSANNPQITVEPAVKTQVRTDPLTIRVNEIGVTEANFTIESISSKLQAYEYNVQWTDAKGFPIHTVTGTWLPFSLLPQEQYTIGIVGPTPDAANFRIYIKGVKK